MFKHTVILWVLCILAMILAACAPAASAPAPLQRDMASKPESAVQSAPAGVAVKPANGANTGGAAPANEAAISNAKEPVGKRIVLMDANLSIVVEKPDEAMSYIGKMAEDMGGFIVTSDLGKVTTENGIEVPRANITVRVPAEQLTIALDKIKALVADPKNDVLSEKVSGQDVTSEYTDLKSRLVNKEKTLDRLTQALAEASATEDILAVSREVSSVSEEVEVLKGQIKYYDEASSLSAITVLIQAQEAVIPLTIGKWEPTGVAREAVQSLIGALKFFVNAGIWIVLFFLPVFIILALPFAVLFFIIRSITRRRRKVVVAPQPPVVEPPAGEPKN